MRVLLIMVLTWPGRIALSYDTLERAERGLDESELSQQNEERSSTLESDSIHRELNLREALVRNGDRRRLSSLTDLCKFLWHNCTIRIFVSAALLGFDVL